MQRLVYSPKAYVYIKDKTDQIRDISNYVVSGTVSRKINQVSSATIEVRNPNMIFTSKDGSGPLFYPMDPITIYLERVRDRPVRVFTGYLDSAPYYQMYPGTLTLTASCTIKKLLYTFFDLALPYTLSFLAEYGWMNDGQGTGKNFDAMNEYGTPALAPLGASSKRVLAIGDTLGMGTDSALKKNLKTYTVISRNSAGKTTDAGIIELQALKNQGPLPGTVIVSLGSNDATTVGFKSKVERALAIVGDQRHLIWANISRPDNYHGGEPASNFNDILASVAKDHPNMTVLDWNKIVDDKTVKLSHDKIHPAPTGYAYRADKLGALTRNVSASADPTKDGADPSKSETKNSDSNKSIGDLIQATLVDIGNWDDSKIFIEALPEGLPERMAALYKQFEDDNKDVKDELEGFFKSIIGSGSSGGGYGGVNDRTSGNPNSTVKVGGGANEKKIFDYMVKRGFTKFQAAAWCGNFAQESNFDPKAVQSNGPGRGLAQWGGGRYAALKTFAARRHTSWSDLQTQLDFVWYELQTSENAAYKQIKATKNLTDAVNAIGSKYERFGTRGNRDGPAKDALKRYG